MELSRVKFDEFMGWMGQLEENLEACQEVLMEAMVRVPLDRTADANPP